MIFVSKVSCLKDFFCDRVGISYLFLLHTPMTVAICVGIGHEYIRLHLLSFPPVDVQTGF